MNSKIKKMVVFIVAILAISIIPTMSKAAYSAKMDIVPDKTSVKPGDTINVVINLKDVKEAGTGVGAIAGILNYDSKFFSSVKMDGVEAANSNWYVPSTQKFSITASNPLTKDGEFKTLQFTVSDTAVGSSKVEFKDLISSGGGTQDDPTLEIESKSDDVTLTFTVSSDDNNDNNNGDNNNNNGDSDNGKDENTTPDEDKTNPSTTGNTPKNDGGSSTKQISGTGSTGVTSKTQLPKAGIKKGIGIAGGILVVVIVGSYVLYKRYPKV